MLAQYQTPEFIAVPMGMICSKGGCPTPIQSRIDPRVVPSGSRAPAGDPMIMLPADVVTRADGDFLYIYEPGAQLVFEVNETGGSILKKIFKSPSTLSEIVAAISADYTNTPADLDHEVYGFLLSLKSSGFNLQIY